MNIFKHGDCFNLMPLIPDHSIDMILADLPYGTTQNKWDSVLPLDKLWKEYWRIAKPNAPVVLTAQCPFDKILGASCIKYLKYEWIWEKTEATGHLNAKKQPMKSHENILVFYQQQCVYNPQMEKGNPYHIKQTDKNLFSSNYGEQTPIVFDNEGTRYPRSVMKIAKDNKNSKIHPTQKPVSLFEYLIKTYTNEGDWVLDNVAGSGTTAVAALNTKRRYICIEKEEEYYLKAMERIVKLCA